MSERLTDEQIEGLRQDSIYERMIVGSDVRMLILDLRHYKKLAEERGKALEWYADKKNWQLGVNITMGSAFPLHEPIKADKGKRARQALQEGEPHDQCEPVLPCRNSR